MDVHAGIGVIFDIVLFGLPIFMVISGGYFSRPLALIIAVCCIAFVIVTIGVVRSASMYFSWITNLNNIDSATVIVNIDLSTDM